MSEKSHDSWTSRWTLRDSTHSTAITDDDPMHLFKGVIADVNFRFTSESNPVKIQESRSVYEIINCGPTTIMGNSHPDIRWIHLPANCMDWIEELMLGLNGEQAALNADMNQENNENSRFDGVLREDLWTNAFHGRHSNSIHSRFMMPLCMRYSSVDPEDPDSDDSESVWKNANVVLLHLPYLHWEAYNSWKDRQKRIANLKELALKEKQCECLYGVKNLSKDEALKNEAMLHKYLLHQNPLHDRRTLDQSYFYNLRNVAHQDKDQVIGLHTWNRAKEQDEGRKMMMTDQLWMWIIDGKTLITAFPETGSHPGDEANVLQRLLENLPRSVQQGTTKSVNGLIALIIDHCTGVFHRSDINPDLAFFEFFADEIGTARAEVDSMLHEFRGTSQSIETLWTDESVSTTRMSRELNSLFSIEKEIRLMENVEKIISDLDKIDFICNQQQEVLRGLVKCSKYGRGTSRSLTDLCETVDSRRKAWSGMGITAKATHDSLHGLLDLKQRQATVSEARTVRYQVEISARQGRSIMLLTIFTIFFLPISVMATIFGMNARELVGKDGGKLSVGTISAIMFPTSVTLVLLGMILAFNEQSREMIAGICSDGYRRWMHTGIGRLGRQDIRV